MQHECKITVLETKVFTDYQESILPIQNQAHVHSSSQEIHLF